MRPTTILLLSTLLLSVFAAGCGGYGSNHNPMMGSAPKITQLNPQNVVANSGAFNLMIEGSGFTSASIVYWNATALVPTVNSGTQLTVGIPAAMVANAGSVSIYVRTAGGNSNTMMFDID